MHQFIIETENLLHNLEIIKEKAKKSKIIAVVKGNAYGLGACEIAKILIANGIEMLAVSRIEEAIELREGGIENEILLLCSTCLKEEASIIVRYNLTATIGSSEAAVLLNGLAVQYGVSVKAHLKVDTGFGRYGFLHYETDKISDVLNISNAIEFTGIYSHFTNSFGKNKSDSQIQYERFYNVLNFLKDKSISYGMAHISNSCALLSYPEFNLDAVRIGSALTGRVILKNKHGLRRVGFLRSEIVEIKWVPKGYNIGYGNVVKTKTNCKIAVLTLGAVDGIGLEKEKGLFRFIDKLRFAFADLRLSQKNALKCHIKGKTAQILGRIGYTSLTLDVTNIGCVVGDFCDFYCNPMYLNKDIERKYI